MRVSTPWLHFMRVLAGPRVAGDHQAPPLAVEAVAERRLDGIVLDQERGDLHAVAIEDLALLDLGDAHRRWLAVDHVPAAHLDVPVQVVEQLVHLPPRAGGAVDLERALFWPTIQRVMSRWPRSIV